MPRLALALWPLLAAVSLAQNPAPPPAVGSVKIWDVINASQKFKEFLAGIEKDKKDLEDTLDRMQKDLDTKKEQVKLLNEDSALRTELQLEMVKMQAVAQFLLKRWNETTAPKLDAKMAELHAQICEETAAAAKAAGLTLVVKMDDARVDAAGGAQAQLSDRAVLFALAGQDLTAEVLKRMDERYAKEKDDALKTGNKDK